MAASQAPADQPATQPRPTVLPENASERNLDQRIAAITGEASVKATGRTEFGQRTISIGDVDEVLGELMAKHGITSDFEFNAKPEVAYEMTTRSEGTIRMWMVDITAILTNADNPEHDEKRRQLFDIGSNPSAAVSFALKRWYRALFKLVEDDDQQGQQQSGGQASGFTNPREAREKPASQPICPALVDSEDGQGTRVCGKPLLRSRPQNDAEKEHPEKLGWFCWKNEARGKHGCGERFTADDERLKPQLQSQRRAVEDDAAGSPSDSANGAPAPVTDAQRAELGKLHDQLPPEFRFDLADKRKLIDQGYEAAKDTLVKLHDEVHARAEEEKASREADADPLVDVDPDEASRAIDAQNTQASGENA